jgi:ribosomal protein S18 acetylase RimI-like enzyme
MVEVNNINYRSIQIPDELDTLVDLWNRCVSEPLTITRELLGPHLNEDPNYDLEGLIGAYTPEEKLVGFALVKRWQVPQHEMGQSDDNQWIRDAKMGVGAIGVDPEYRHQEIGSGILRQVEKFTKKHDGTVLTIGREPGYHLFPGIPELLEEFMEFFGKNGFNGGIESAIDIIGDISNIDNNINSKLTEKITANEADGFAVISYEPSLKDSLLDFMKREFSGRWFWKVKTFIENPLNALDELQILIQHQGDDLIIAGFASTCTQASTHAASPTIVQSQGKETFGGLGPIGIGKDYRGSKGLGAMLLHYALVNLKNKGVTTVLIDWTSHGLLNRFYGPAGFKLYMNYVSLSKELA